MTDSDSHIDKLPLDQLGNTLFLPQIPDQFTAYNSAAPRSYQLELFQKAIEGNVIAALDTGSGKTFIAVLLVRHMLTSVEHLRRTSGLKRNHTFFLVPTVPLVPQQAHVLRANIPGVVAEFSGGMGVEFDSWDMARWHKEFGKTDVFCCTPQVLLSMLRRGFIGLEDINLIVFDECHHARKRHPYNIIMIEFYSRCPVDQRPKIFGLTASPLNTRSSAVTSASDLERNLCCRIFTSNNLAEIQQFVARPDERVIPYPAPPKYNQADSPLFSAIASKINRIPKYAKLLVEADWAFRNLGPWAGEDALVKGLYGVDETTRRKVGGIRGWHGFDRDADDAESTKDASEMTDENPGFSSSELSCDDSQLIHEAIELASSARMAKPKKNINSLSPKVIELLNVLYLFRMAPTFRGIVFVDRRRTAKQLCSIISSFRMLGFLHPEALVGHGQSSGGNTDVRMAHREQKNVLARFRKGTTNLLVATKVAEEGLDIPECMLVVRFDFFSTLIEYIQSRGRARMVDSDYILMIQEHDTRQEALYNEIQAHEEEIREWMQRETCDRRVLEDAEEDHVEDEHALAYMFIVPTTKAVVTLNAAVSLLHYYCSLLPKDFYCRLNPIFEVEQSQDESGFVCTITLPSNAPIRTITGDAMRSKPLARQHAALRACAALYEKGALNDHLMPFREHLELEDGPLQEEDLLLGARKSKRKYKMRTPRFWHVPDASTWTETDSADEEGPALAGESADLPNGLEDSKRNEPPTLAKPILPKLYITILWLTASNSQPMYNNGTPLYRTLGFLTRDRLPENCTVPLFTNMGKISDMSMQAIGVTSRVRIGSEQAQLLAQYTLLVTAAVVNKVFKCEAHRLPLFLIPLVQNFQSTFPNAFPPDDRDLQPSHPHPETLIDWATIEHTCNAKSYPIDPQKIVPSPSTSSISQDGSITEWIKDAMLVDFADKGRRYFLEEIRWDLNPRSQIAEVGSREARMGCNTTQDYYTKLFRVKLENENQPLLEVSKISKILNYISPHYRSKEVEKSKTIAKYIIPEFCSAHRIHASVYRSVMLLPSVLTRLDSLLLALEVKYKYGLPVQNDFLLEAFTSPSANMTMDYERLEHLGDSFLKMVTTVQLFLQYPEKHEGQLHCQRIRFISNKALFKSARRMGLPMHMTSKPFNRRIWKPHGVDVVNGENDPSTHHTLSDKTVADVVEALLGACLLSGGVEAALQCANACHVPLDNQPSWKDFVSRWKPPPEIPLREILKKINISFLEETLGYKFRYPQLLLEAMTHPSYPFAITPCYQRLEFLGDALLDFFVVTHNHAKHGEMTPGALTEIKDASVNKQILSAVCERMGVFTHTLFFSNDLMKACDEFLTEINDMREEGRLDREYWFEFNPPKMLSDVIESLLGAVFVDSGFCIPTAQRVFDGFFRPVLDQYLNVRNLKQHPIKELIWMMQTVGCDKLDIKMDEESLPNQKMNRVRCTITLHDKLVAENIAEHIKAARCSAAIASLERLRNEPDFLMEVCDCAERRGREKEEGAANGDIAEEETEEESEVEDMDFD